MIKIYFLTLLICLTFVSYSQTPAIETVGKPDTSTPVSLYTGWTNQGVLKYTGNAEVQNENPSNNYPYASGDGNVFFTNVPGTYFQISGLPYYGNDSIGGIDIAFNISGYDTDSLTNFNDLALSISKDSGITWFVVPYNLWFASSLNTWIFVYAEPGAFYDSSGAHPTQYSEVNIGKVMFRFTQTSSTKTFRIDDIEIKEYFLLPITLQYFTAVPDNGKAVLTWQANSSSSKELFVIEKSNDGRDFSPLSQEYAKGQGNYIYTYNDKLNNNKAFYRLKIINAEGKSSYSGIVIVNSKRNSNQLVQTIYPVPAKDILHLQINGSTDEQITLLLTDIGGRQLVRKTPLIKKGINAYDINIQSLPAGNYYLTILTTDKAETHKIIVSSQ